MVELLRNGTRVAQGLTRCITGVTRNPTLATEAIVHWDAFDPVPLSSGDALALRMPARIGTTTATGAKCSGPGGSHSSATGLRLYYDSGSRQSRIDATIAPNGGEEFYLHSSGSACPGGNGQSTGVTTRSLNTAGPAGPSAKCKDSGVVHFAGWNPFAVIGTWSFAPIP